MAEKLVEIIVKAWDKKPWDFLVKPFIHKPGLFYHRLCLLSLLRYPILFEFSDRLFGRCKLTSFAHHANFFRISLRVYQIIMNQMNPFYFKTPGIIMLIFCNEMNFWCEYPIGVWKYHPDSFSTKTILMTGCMRSYGKFFRPRLHILCVSLSSCV